MTTLTPNQVTAARVVAAFAAVALFTFGHDALVADATAILLTIAAIALDGVDGYIARKRNLATPLGAQFDILGDRVVENLFFTFFAATGLISFWILLRRRCRCFELTGSHARSLPYADYLEPG